MEVCRIAKFTKFSDRNISRERHSQWCSGECKKPRRQNFHVALRDQTSGVHPQDWTDSQEEAWYRRQSCELFLPHHSNCSNPLSVRFFLDLNATMIPLTKLGRRLRANTASKT